MDFDPRDSDSRDDERWGTNRGYRGSADTHDRDDDRRQPDVRSHDRDDDARTLGRGPGDSRQSNGDEQGRDPRDDARWPDRDREPRDRAVDPREAFTRDLNLNLPRGLEREIVRDRDREYTLRGSETRARNRRCVSGGLQP